jgi:hypothetical protein
MATVKEMSMSEISAVSPARITLTAGDSLFAAGVAHANQYGVEKVSHLFPSLFSVIEKIRTDWGWQPTGQNIFVVGVDLRSERQGGLLQRAREAGAIVDALDFRDCFPSPMPGGASLPQAGVFVGKSGTADFGDQDSGEAALRLRPSLGSRLSYLLGGLAGRLPAIKGDGHAIPAEVLVVCHHYELKDALLELHARGARVGVAFYRELLEPRWGRHLFDPDSKIRFADLRPYLSRVTTLGDRATLSKTPRPSASDQLF